jgi:CRP-like cAMP-binding protein
MFAQLLVYCKFHELDRGGILYEKGKLTCEFYCVVNGELLLTIDDNGEKANRTIEAGMIFGFREYYYESNDFTTAKQPQTQVIRIPSFVYKEIITQT